MVAQIRRKEAVAAVGLIFEVEAVVAALGWESLLTDLLAMRPALKQVGDRVSEAVSANSHRCCHMLAVRRNGRSSKGLERSVFVRTIVQLDLRVGRRAVAVAVAVVGTVEGRTSRTTVCLCLHYCTYANGIRAPAVDIAGAGAVAVAVAGAVAGAVAQVQRCCLRPRRWSWGCPPTQVSAQIGTMRSRPSRSCRAIRLHLGLSRILSADGEDEMA